MFGQDIFLHPNTTPSQVITVPYALANLSLLSFKKISDSDYLRFSQAVFALQQIHHEIYRGDANIGVELNKLRKQLRQKHMQSEPLYVEAMAKLDRFKQKHWSILSTGKHLEDAEEYSKLSWVFSLSSKENDLARHYARYQHVYNQLRALEHEVTILRPFSKDFIEETIKKEENKLKQDLEYRNEANLKQWTKKIEQKREKQSNILLPTKQYSYLVKNLSIRKNGTFYDISCEAVRILDGRSTLFYQTTINNAIQIIR